ncbi:MAG: hypothetical protein M3Q80_02935 [bacterium]|nr:hypothetical protein [bacterium]
METKFQTSFIPKKAMIPNAGGAIPPREKHRSSLLMSVAVLLFITSLLGGAGTYAYKSLLTAQLKKYEAELNVRKKGFDLVLIQNLKRHDVKLKFADQLLKNHLALSQIFGVIGELTVEDVRFISMDLTAGAGDIKIGLKGYGSDFPTIAFQSKVLSQLESYGLRKIIKNPILTDPAQDATNKTITFGLTATIDPSHVAYKNFFPADEGTTTAELTE